MDQNKIFTKSNLKIWSKLGMRASFGMAALELSNNVNKLTDDMIKLIEFVSKKVLEKTGISLETEIKILK